MGKLINLFALLSPSVCFAQGTITFDGTPEALPGTDIGVRQYSEQGMLFYAIGSGGQFGRNGGGFSAAPDDGSAYIDTAAGESVAFRLETGSTFGVFSADLAEYSTVYPDPVTVTFTGYHADGSTINTSFTTDGIIDGTGPLKDFQTFDFGAGWTDLNRVEISPDGWSLDNLVVAVPEPSTSTFLALGAIIIGLKIKK